MHDKATFPDIPIQATPSARHRKQMVWQVWVPLIATIVILLALAVLAVIGAFRGSPQVDHWGAIAAIWVIIPVLITGIILMAIVGGSAYGVSVLLKHMPEWMLKAQLFMIHLALTVRRVADAATKPVFGVSTTSAKATTIWRRILHWGRS